VFDYVSDQDFKFAGFDISTNKLVIGQRTAAGWNCLSQTPFLGKADQWYDVLLSINGASATVVIGGKSSLYSFTASIESGISYGLNWDLVGFGTNNARGAMDNITVQVLPPSLSIVRAEKFSAGSTLAMFGNETTGTWTTPNGRITRTSALELTVTLNTTNRSGVVFDRYANGDFKWAAFDVVSKQVLIGHYAKGAWAVDSFAAFTSLTASTDHNLTLFIKGSTVSVTVANLAGTASALVSHAFNGLAVDGGFGLLVKGGSASFDKVTAKTDDTKVPATLLASTAAIASDANVATLSDADLRQLTDAALARWSLTQDKGLGDLAPEKRTP